MLFMHAYFSSVVLFVSVCTSCCYLNLMSSCSKFCNDIGELLYLMASQTERPAWPVEIILTYPLLIDLI